MYDFLMLRAMVLHDSLYTQFHRFSLFVFSFSLKFMFTILSISDSDKHREKVVEEYTKRLGKSVKIENIKPSRKGNNEQMIQADTENIIAKLEKFSDYKKILLSKEGKIVTTMDLHTMLIDKNCVFIIG